MREGVADAAGAPRTFGPGDHLGSQRTPGELLKPLGWMAPRLFNMARRQPDLAVRLLGLERPQIHLLGFALAHNAADDMLGASIGAPARDVLRYLGMENMAGLGRVLRRLPGELLSLDGYRRIASLLGDSFSAGILHHRKSIGPSLLRNLVNLPCDLRTQPIVVALEDIPRGPYWLQEWIGLMAERRGDPDERQVRALIAGARTTAVLRKRVEDLVESLPLPDGLPPLTVGNARRVDAPPEIRRLARRFRNCLRERLDEIHILTALFYLWDDGECEVICEVVREGRCSWLLKECLGPDNKEPQKDILQAIEAEFRAVAIWPHSVADFGVTMMRNIGVDDAVLQHHARRHVYEMNDDDPEEPFCIKPDEERNGDFTRQLVDDVHF